MTEAIWAWDTSLFYAIHNIRSPFLDTVMPLVSLSWWPLAAIGAAFVFWIVHIVRAKSPREHVRYALFCMLLLGAGSALTEAAHYTVKYEVRRARPGHTLPDVRHFSSPNRWRLNTPDFIPVQYRGDSFFSGHAAHSAVLAVSAATICPPLAPLVYAAPLAVGYSRIYLGRHYPLDVVCGWIAGALIGLGLRRATRRLRNKLRPPSGSSR